MLHEAQDDPRVRMPGCFCRTVRALYILTLSHWGGRCDHEPSIGFSGASVEYNPIVLRSSYIFKDLH